MPKSIELDLTGAYYLNLSAKGAASHMIRVRYADHAAEIFSDYRDHNGLGASDMKKGCGDVTDANGTLIGRISYNGRIWDASGKPFDGMNGQEWIAAVSR